MAGQVKRMLDHIVDERGKGDAVLATITRAKLILKGFDPEKFTPTTPDDAASIDRVKQIAEELGIKL